MVITAEGQTYHVREGYRPGSAEYRQIVSLAKTERVLQLTRITIQTAAKQGDADAVRRLTFQADRQQSRANAMREQLKEVLA